LLRTAAAIIISIVIANHMKLKLRAVGTSTGVILPKELLHRLRVKKDDSIFAVETPDGYLLTPYDPEVEEQVRLGLEIMAKRRNIFRALAK
jgi:putative addiction module antidote